MKAHAHHGHHAEYVQEAREGAVRQLGVGPAQPSRAEIPARLRTIEPLIAEDRPGSWMDHCHILEHHEAGMMGHFEVVR